MDVWIVTIILIIALILLVTEKIAIDLTAIGIMAALMITGILTPQEAVRGFANPAVITVGAMFLISRAMVRTGAVGYIGRQVTALARGSTHFMMILIMMIVALFSAFINNTLVVVLFIPIVLSISCEYDFSPSKFLIPVSYVSILAGTCTLIGTSTNIIVSDLSAMYGHGQLGMFELSRLGVPIAVLGMAFLFFGSPLIMPKHAEPVCELEDREDRRYLAEFFIPEESPLIGKEAASIRDQLYPSFELFEIIRGNRIHYPEEGPTMLQEGDLVLVKGSANDLVAVLNEGAAALPHLREGLNFSPDDKDALIVELIVPPQSSLLGERLLEADVFQETDIHLIAMKRRRIHYTEQRIGRVRLRIGDIILVKCAEKKLVRFREGTDFILIEDVHHEIVHKRKARWAALIFTGIVAAASTEIADIMTCALSGVFLMILTGCIQMRDFQRAIRRDVLLLIVGTIALGAAMEKTGTSGLYAKGFLSIFAGLSPGWVLFGIILLTSISTQLLSNNATAVLILPIAISTAAMLGVSPKPFIVGVCFGASACYATPIGYQTNLLVYGPGGYRFGDYLKLGIPLNLLVLLAAALLVPRFWPFHL